MGSYSLSDAIAHAWRSLHDEGATAAQQQLTDAELTAFLREAASRYSGDRPGLAVADLTADGTDYLDLPTGWADAFSRIETVEVDGEAITAGSAGLYLSPGADPGDPPVLQVRWAEGYAPAAGSTVRVRYTVPRVFGATAGDTTIPDAHYYGVVALGASFGADAVAAKFAATHAPLVSADVADYRSKAEEWAGVARRLRDRAERHLAAAEGHEAGTVIGASSGWARWAPHARYRRITR